MEEQSTTYNVTFIIAHSFFMTLVTGACDKYNGAVLLICTSISAFVEVQFFASFVPYYRSPINVTCKKQF